MGADLDKAREIIARSERLRVFSVQRQGAELHMEKGGESFARLRPGTGRDAWCIEVFREAEEWEILDFQGTLEQCLDFLTEQPHYLFWDR